MHEAMTPEVKTALDECREIIRKGSKSFSLAARLFDPATRDAAFFLYGCVATATIRSIRWVGVKARPSSGNG